MNILLINHYAGSPAYGMEYRPYYMARAWQKLGHRVRIVASSFSHVRSRQPAAETAKLESVEGVDYFWIPGRPYQGNGVGRIRNMVSFVTGLFRHASAMTSDFKPDAVISSSTYPLDALPASFLARRHGAKLVHEIHDLWPLSPMELGNMSRWHPFIVAMQAAEEFAYRRAGTVVSMLPKAEDHMRAHGLRPGKFVYVPNGIDVSEWSADRATLPPTIAATLAELRGRSPFLVGYAGAHGVANALDTLLAGAARVKDQGVGVVVVGQGPEKANLQAKAEQLGLTNVLFLDPIRKNAIPSLLEQMDALYIGLQRQPLFRFGVSPNKLMDYMMAAKPVISAIEAGNDIVADAGCGLSISPENPDAVADAMRKLAATSSEALRAMGHRGKQYILEHHSYDVLAPTFLEALES